jgi:hypothetical protein
MSRLWMWPLISRASGAWTLFTRCEPVYRRIAQPDGGVLKMASSLEAGDYEGGGREEDENRQLGEPQLPAG